ncbi:MAG TPA: chromate resistance protein ChrB domain-containing protein [Burkholderiaceae bacterium]|jgi:rhodanese-related sulfurtransferase|nr:chromate resistance protein ChrB domain-containing protein [Burkholderiaceae bacterium]
MDDSRFSVSPAELRAKLGTAAAPVLVDVRRSAAFDEDDTMIAGAMRRDPSEVDRWKAALPRRPVVVYCVHGHEVSQSAAAALRAAGFDARYLQGGKAAWVEQGYPIRRKCVTTPSQWITRQRPKVDRVACPWLIRRFIDPEALFLYVPSDRVLAQAKATGAIPYDIPGAEPFSHDGDSCSFDGFLKTFGLSDPALDRLALIVRGADTGRLDLTPQSGGLLAISLGLSANHADDDLGMLDHAMTLYDALYAWCRSLPGQPNDRKPDA